MSNLLRTVLLFGKKSKDRGLDPCPICGDAINERVKLLRGVRCSTEGCPVVVHRVHLKQLNYKRRPRSSKSKRAKASFACPMCEGSIRAQSTISGVSTSAGCSTIAEDEEPAVYTETEDEGVELNRYSQYSVADDGGDMSLDPAGDDRGGAVAGERLLSVERRLVEVQDSLAALIASVQALHRKADAGADTLRLLGQEVGRLHDISAVGERRRCDERRRLAEAVRILGGAEEDEKRPLLLNGVHKENAEDYRVVTPPAPLAEIDVVDSPVSIHKVEIHRAMSSPSFSEPPSPAVESLTNGVQALQIKGPSSQYQGKIDQVLDQTLKRLKLQEDEIKKTNQFLDQMVKKDLVDGLKEQSPLFGLLYKEIAWTGSSYEGLKISKPDEFDLNVVLKMPPFKAVSIEVVARDDLPGYVTVKSFKAAITELEADPAWKPVYGELEKWTDDSGHLQQNKVSRWFESIITKFKDWYNNKATADDIKIDKVKKSGPAMTLCFGKLSIDVVPVFAFTEAPPSPIRQPKPLNREWVIVPKPQSVENGNVTDAWRSNFYQYERDILRDFGKIKPAIKLMKKLRDNQNWKSLYSYAIKTVALWMIEEGGDKDIKKDDSVGVAFMKLLSKVQFYLKDGKLPFFWDKRSNLFKMTEKERANVANCLGNLIKKFEANWMSNPASVGESIVPETLEQIQEANQAHEKNRGDNSCNVG